ncbi:MAG TPA: hypothetical protein VNJ01_17705 [Bacteriovoracaceae bacterium]|nr:hypothetical protein [Bacteriovoracaceae bacterium]
MKFQIFMFVSVAVLSSCASKPAKDPGATAAGTTAGTATQSEATSMESKILASQEESNLVTEISFSKGVASISGAAKKELSALFTKAKSRGTVDDIKVITWGDREYPSKMDKELSEVQVNLVEKRNDAIKAYFEGIDKDADVEVFSMAMRPGMINKLMSGDDAKIKKSLEASGIPNTDSKGKTASKASKSIVIFTLEQ